MPLNHLLNRLAILVCLCHRTITPACISYTR
jgi:hypothetical protein